MVATTEVLTEITVDVFAVVLLEVLADVKAMDADRKNLYVISV